MPTRLLQSVTLMDTRVRFLYTAQNQKFVPQSVQHTTPSMLNPSTQIKENKLAYPSDYSKFNHRRVVLIEPWACCVQTEHLCEKQTCEGG